jgi:hypothetical protein
MDRGGRGVKIQVTFDKKDTAQAYLKADDYFLALYDTWQLLRQGWKYEEIPIDQLYDRFFGILSEYGINIDDEVDFWDDVS